MSEPTKELRVDCSVVSDRGLNERRPLNEDSYLADGKRRIFAVADGVGGAEAGEVASKTAVEVLDEAFQHQLENADVEDLMELAIQRANASIHQMSHDHLRLANMATTIVALHIDGTVATIGHVGDSRLYRLTPDGKLLRETEDHSIVEEEVRAGRMTPEQAANHPSKNVISRALGAEETVEVDLKTVQVEEGTAFLLCSDGITRHIPDNELRSILVAQDDLANLCEELKRKCYERGAEDNLTAVLVRVGDAPDYSKFTGGERTLQIEAPATQDGTAAGFRGNLDKTEDALVAPSRIAFPSSSDATPAITMGTEPRPMNIQAPRPSGGAGKSVLRFFVFLLFVGVAAAAFYFGTRYRGALPFGLRRPVEAVTVPSPTPVPEDPVVAFEKERRVVDAAPADWINSTLPKELSRQNLIKADDSLDPKFLYLYGRALLLTGDYDGAARSFQEAIARVDQTPTAENATIRKEAVIAFAAASLKLNKDTAHAATQLDEIVPKPASTTSPSP
jgi:PPM family protein phosphatase